MNRRGFLRRIAAAAAVPVVGWGLASKPVLTKPDIVNAAFVKLAQLPDNLGANKIIWTLGNHRVMCGDSISLPKEVFG